MSMRLKKSSISLTKNGGAYLLGLFATQNIIYLFTVGATNINIEWVLALVVFVLLFLLKPTKIIQSVKSTPKEIKYYILAIFLSFIPSIIYAFISGNNFLSSYFNGLIALFLSICVFYDCISLGEFKDSIIRGLYHGLILNVVFSLLQYFYFRSGSYLTLYSYFPQKSFFVSIPWDRASALAENSYYLIYSYRAMGFFLECSYFVAHMTCIILILFTYKKNNIFLMSLFIVLTLLIAISGSGNFVIYILGMILYWILAKKEKRRKLTTRTLLISLPVLFLLIVVGTFFVSKIDTAELINGIFLSINGANINDVSNATRLTFMLSAISLYLEYPLGVGYNIGPKALLAYSNTHASFNYLINMLLETGPIGLLSYLYMMGKNSLFYIKNINITMRNLGIVVMIMWFYQFANGTGFTSIIWVLFALIVIEKKTKDSEG